jgi:ABC-type Fe3+/spermidine/putrescine transport system ATPase subunit
MIDTRLESEFAAAAGTPEPQLRLRGISKTYSASDGKVLDDIDLDIAPGELVTLLGPSGCGKSTLLRTVAGFIHAEEGSIEIAGADITRVPTHKRNVGIVHQSHALWPHMTVAENLSFGLEMHKVKRASRERLVSDMLEVVGLGGYERRIPPELSGGQQQRVALARALVIEPQVLLLDEPLSSLDANLRVHLREEIRRIQRELGVTTIFVTHDREEAMAVSDRIVLLEGGIIAQQGSATDLYRRPDSLFVMTFTGSVVKFEGVVEPGPAGQGPVAATRIGRFPLDAAASVPVELGDEIIAAFRPEDIGVVGPNAVHDDVLLVDATLDDASFLGTSVEARLIVGDQRIEARLHPRELNSLPPVGDQVRLCVDPSHVHVFSSKSQSPQSPQPTTTT